MRTFLVTNCLLVVLFANSQSLQLLKDVNTTGFVSSSYPFDFTVADNHLFFIATNNTGAPGVWRTDGSEAGTELLTPSPGALYNIRDIAAYNNKVYFANDDGISGPELWVTDGTSAGTVMLKDLIPGSTGSFPQGFTVVNNLLLFMAAGTDGDRRLYVTDGTASGTVIIRNNFISQFNGIPDFPVLGNSIYFVSDNGSGSGFGLWKSDGTPAGTVLVKPDLNPGVAPGNYAVLNDKLYFSAFDNTSGNELWVTDGSNAGTHIVLNLSSDAGGILGNGEPQDLIVYHDKIYFSARDDAHGVELFVTDGSAIGTQLVKDLVPGTGNSVPYQSIVYNDVLYFTTAATPGLWKTDGTEVGTGLVKGGLNNAKIAGLWNGKIYLIMGDDLSVWQSDGTTSGTVPIQLLNTSNPVYSQSADFLFKEFGGALYLSASNTDRTIGFEPSKLFLAALPLHLLSFDGVLLNLTDVLTWQTADEINTDAFLVQQSNDGIQFSDDARIAARGDGKYEFSQPAGKNPAGIYRLKMLDKDGKFTYSPVIKIRHGRDNKIAVRFDPSGKTIVVSNNGSGICQWRLLGANGVTLRQGSSADPIIRIATGGLPDGLYIISCGNAASATTKQIVIR